MAAVGFLWLVGDLYWIPGALAFTIAATFALFYQNVLAHLALAYRAGGFERRVMVGLYARSLVDNLVRMLFFENSAGAHPLNGRQAAAYSAVLRGHLARVA